jgi:hypothetical protein
MAKGKGKRGGRRATRSRSRPSRDAKRGAKQAKITAVRRRRKAHASFRLFSNGKAVKADVSRKTASVVGRYLAAVRRLLETNDAQPLEEFAGQSIKDNRGTAFPLETRPNVLYRLNAAIEPFEEFYQRLA